MPLRIPYITKIAVKKNKQTRKEGTFLEIYTVFGIINKM
ncbi:hypothetical protein QSI_1429 [Clostridioides difficile P28]|nr:hypothetical protein QSI_1429 [Clostridioides difficile P28]